MEDILKEAEPFINNSILESDQKTAVISTHIFQAKPDNEGTVKKNNDILVKMANGGLEEILRPSLAFDDITSK
ncbi:hypothetical protein [Piscirickettsia litoralis]|uniref:Uncharacterized protein n=1 Tax=Piscirickettsia litoralis TaxID=1891921 RepID=A0ABX3A6F8_9GAMM|nr:hypothetical protein [Piscirickettsia litoralis]ODN41684.1 hypothetical protein BGC07_00170 [Piscirickettsia litoralis]